MKFFIVFSLAVIISFVECYETVCYGELGCFTDAPPWGDTQQRPVGYVPSPPEEVNTRFYLDTRQEYDVEVFYTDMLELSRGTTFDYAKPTKFIVHGFLQNGDTSWMTQMSNEFLQEGDYNVIRVGWIGGSLTINYALSATDTQIVGAEISLFINNIVNFFGGTTKTFHCIGHSLGAQACSYLGAGVSSKVDRITGLDPAGPYFEDTPKEVRLDSTDADFVDVIHTDAEKLKDFGYGINQVSGHIDFWPNNGIEQPGCDQNILSTILGPDGIVEGTQDFVACNHLRALDFFTESIRSSCPFAGNICPSYDDYLNGKCLVCSGGTCSKMGYHSIDNKDQILKASNPNNYLQTADLKPFCEYMMYPQVTLGSRGDTIEGRLYLSLYGSTENTEQVQLSGVDENLTLRPGTTYSYLAQYSTFPSGLYRVKLLWTQEEWSVTSQHITVDHITVWSDFEQVQYTFCGDSNAELSQDVRYSFYLC